MAVTFLQRSRHKSVYYFRRKVPLDLRSLIGAAVIYKTLRTADRRHAVVMARALAAHTDKLFIGIRGMGNKQDPGAVRVDYGLSIDLDELTGRVRRVQVNDIKPGEEEVARAELQKLHDDVMAKQPPVTATTPFSPPTPTIREAMDLYFAEDMDIKGRSKQRYHQLLRPFVSHFGEDRPLGTVDQQEFNKYADQVKAAGMSWSTQKNRIGTAARFLSWSQIRGRTPHVVSARTLKPSRKTPARRDRGAFSEQELRAIFENAAHFRLTKKHAKFWITVASAFLGGRVEELAQLDFERDLKQTPDGTWYIRVQENHEEEDWMLKQSAKTMASWRDVPLHSALVKHGFVDFLLNEKRLGARRPFERYWKPYKNEKFQVVVYSHKIAKWGGRELKKLQAARKITTPRVSYFHSHRHTLATVLAGQGVSEAVRAAIAGQEYGGINNELYSKLKERPDLLAPLMEKHLVLYAGLLDEVMARRTDG